MKSPAIQCNFRIIHLVIFANRIKRNVVHENSKENKLGEALVKL